MPNSAFVAGDFSPVKESTCISTTTVIRKPVTVFIANRYFVLHDPAQAGISLPCVQHNCLLQVSSAWNLPAEK
jgi:hypothetical protein